MTADGEHILKDLQTVARERRRRAGDPALAQRVDALKRYQHARFERTYRDLAAVPRYADASRFFLDEIYGPRDFSERDAQFARIVPALVRLFPADVVGTVRQLGQLHALSEELDTLMAEALATPEVDAARYQTAWCATGRPADRQLQIDLMVAVGRSLDRHTSNLLLRQSLRLMRRPAQAAGLGALQHFLEAGFEAFRRMRGADDFLRTVAERERALAAELFGTTPAP